MNDYLSADPEQLHSSAKGYEQYVKNYGELESYLAENLAGGPEYWGDDPMGQEFGAIYQEVYRSLLRGVQGLGKEMLNASETVAKAGQVFADSEDGNDSSAQMLADEYRYGGGGDSSGGPANEQLAETLSYSTGEEELVELAPTVSSSRDAGDEVSGAGAVPGGGAASGGEGGGGSETRLRAALSPLPENLQGAFDGAASSWPDDLAGMYYNGPVQGWDGDGRNDLLERMSADAGNERGPATSGMGMIAGGGSPLYIGNTLVDQEGMGLLTAKELEDGKTRLMVDGYEKVIPIPADEHVQLSDGQGGWREFSPEDGEQLFLVKPKAPEDRPASGDMEWDDHSFVEFDGAGGWLPYRPTLSE